MPRISFWRLGDAISPRWAVAMLSRPGGKVVRFCPGCKEPVKRFRSQPSPYSRVFAYRLYECDRCEKVIETTEVVTREGSSASSKRYISRIEPTRRAGRAKRDPEAKVGADSVRDGTNAEGKSRR